MFEKDITKESYNILCIIYKVYLQRRKDNMPKRQAVTFEHDTLFQKEHLPNVHPDDMYAAIVELKNIGYVKHYVDGGFSLTDDGILLMENRFKNNISDVIDFISNIPFI